MLRGNPLAIVAGWVAAYSKETAVLLAPAAYLVWPGGRRAKIAVAAALLVGFAVVQAAIRLRIGPVAAVPFTFPLPYNLLDIVALGNWQTCLWLLLGLLIYRHRAAYPARLRRLIFIPLALLAMALPLGWLFELRQYFEALPVIGLMALHALAIESGKFERIARPDVLDMA